MSSLMITAVLLTACAASSADGQGDQKALATFAEGRALVVRNCYDCMDGSREDMEKGVDLILRAVGMGYEPRVEAYKLLAYAYNQLAGYAESKEGQVFKLREKEAYEELIKLEPANPEFLYNYAGLVPEHEQRASLLREVLEIDPGHNFARALLGLLLLRRGDTSEGTELLRQAFISAEGADARQIGEWWVSALHDLGRQKEAEKLRAEVELLPQE